MCTGLLNSAGQDSYFCISFCHLGGEFIVLAGTDSSIPTCVSIRLFTHLRVNSSTPGLAWDSRPSVDFFALCNLSICLFFLHQVSISQFTLLLVDSSIPPLDIHRPVTLLSSSLPGAQSLVDIFFASVTESLSENTTFPEILSRQNLPLSHQPTTSSYG